VPPDAPPVPVDGRFDLAHCDSPPGTAALTAAHATLEPQYARMYAGGTFTGGGHTGQPRGFDLVALFTNQELTTPGQVESCELDRFCGNHGFVIEFRFERGEELGDHTASIINSLRTWSVTGTVTFTDFVYPETTVGHLAGSLHVASLLPEMTIDGTFDNAFCPGLLQFTL